MNVNAMVVSQLRKRREKLVAELAGIDAALTAFGGSTSTSSTRPARTRKRKRSPAQIAAIKKAQDARKASLAAKKSNGPVARSGDTGHPLRQGASLAEAAG